MKSAMRDNLINYINLDFYYPKSNNVHKIHIFSKAEQRKIIDYCMNNLNIKTACILLTLYSGIRIGKLCALKWKDIDFKRNILYVNKTIQRIYIKPLRESKVIITDPKTKNANREIPLNREFALLLKRFKTSNDNYILSNSSKWMEPRSFREFYYVSV